MAVGLRGWSLALCITFLYIRSTSPKIVEGTLSTKEVQYSISLRKRIIPAAPKLQN